MNNKVVANGGISFVGLLQIVFIVLKLCKVINWHWALVMLPLEISVGTAVIALIVTLIVVAVQMYIESKRRRR